MFMCSYVHMFICELYHYANSLSSICKVCSPNFVQGVFFKFRYICTCTHYCRTMACPRRSLSLLYAPLFHNQQVRPSYNHMIMCSYVHMFICSCVRLHCYADRSSSMRKVFSSNSDLLLCSNLHRTNVFSLRSSVAIWSIDCQWQSHLRNSAPKRRMEGGVEMS